MAQVTMATAFDVAFSRDALANSWERLKRAKTDQLTRRIRIPPGWDGVTVARFERQLAQHLAAIERQAKSNRYTFRPFLYHMQPKADGGERRIAYSGIRDRLVQAALHDVLAPAIETQLTDSAYAYRSGRSTHDAIREIYRSATSGQPFFVKSDFVKFFDRLDHTRLRALVDGLDVDGRAKQLAWRFVRTGDTPRDEDRSTRAFPLSRRIGVPQGGVISGLLANLYLAEFDQRVRTIAGATLIRYADDFVVFCENRKTCEQVFGLVSLAAADALLELHEGAKTVQGYHINDGINFVGFRMRGTKVMVKPSNVTKFKKRVQALLNAHETKLREGEYTSPHECVRQALYHLNLKVTGVELDGIRRSWIAYFRIINDVNQIRRLDRWMWTRLALMIRRVGLGSLTRSQVFDLGYRGLYREYWHVRRQLRAFALPATGMLVSQPMSGSDVPVTFQLGTNQPVTPSSQLTAVEPTSL